MENATLGEGKAARKLVFHRVAENLHRLEQSGGYYALLKRGDKQFRRSLKTKDRKLAERRLVELKTQIGNLTIGEDAHLSFDQICIESGVDIPTIARGDVGRCVMFEDRLKW